MWIVILIKIHAESKPIPLHFNAFYGIEFVGSGFYFLEIPFIGLVLLGINFILASKVFAMEKFLSKVMCYSTALLQVMFLIAVISIVLINS